MPTYLQTFLEELISTHETEINYHPLIIPLDPTQVNSKEDIERLCDFLKEKRKRFFIFKFPAQAATEELKVINQHLEFTARHAILNDYAVEQLKTSTLPRINPLKLALNDPDASVRAPIQIQKDFLLPGSTMSQNQAPVVTQQHAEPSSPMVPLLSTSTVFSDPKYQHLLNQFNALGIQLISPTAAKKIKANFHAFTDGIVVNNLPEGFYIDDNQHALCFTKKPQTLPTALAPILETAPLDFAWPTNEAFKVLLKDSVSPALIDALHSSNVDTQKEALLTVFTTHQNSLTSFIQTLSPTNQAIVIPLLAKSFLIARETYTHHFAQLIGTLLTKDISLDFLKHPVAQQAFLYSPKGMKNLQKLIKLPAEQRAWWNTLALAHLQHQENRFDFNAFFEAYTQGFLPKIKEKNLILPRQKNQDDVLVCPIKHTGHFLTTLNRVLDVLVNAANPEEQCANLNNLNWGPTGVHYAMMHAPLRFKQVAACMQLDSEKDTETSVVTIHALLGDETLDLKTWAFRYCGQHWKTKISLNQLDSIFQKLSTRPTAQRNQLIFMLTCTYANPAEMTADQLQAKLNACLAGIEKLTQPEQNGFIAALTRCYQFKPVPSLSQMHALIEQCLDLKEAFPAKPWHKDIVDPLFSCLENEGFTVLNRIQERVQKLDASPTQAQAVLAAQLSFASMIQHQRPLLQAATTVAYKDLMHLLTAINEQDLTQSSPALLQVIEDIKKKKGESFCQVLLHTLGQLNIAKSQPLPNMATILTLLNFFAAHADPIPSDCNTPEKQQAWFIDKIINAGHLPGCTFGDGDVTKLNDLIIDGLALAVKKRGALLNKMDAFKEKVIKIFSGIPKPAIRKQLNEAVLPLIDAFKELVRLLQTDDPEFNKIIAAFKLFEETKPKLINGLFDVGIPLGSAHGTHLLSLLLTGKINETSTAEPKPGTLFTKAMTTGILGAEGVHMSIMSAIRAYFDDPENKKQLNDIDIDIIKDWFDKFNTSHSLMFLFKDELVEKKVKPAIMKVLAQLNTGDVAFEKRISDDIQDLSKTGRSDELLTQYKTKIQGIADYLNLLIEIKVNQPTAFPDIYKNINAPTLIKRLNYNQKIQLIKTLLRAPASLQAYLKLTTIAIENHTDADEIAIQRAFDGIDELLQLPDLAPETQTQFFKMVLAHNLKSPSAFPLKPLIQLNKLALPEDKKPLLVNQIIHVLGKMDERTSPSDIDHLITQTLAFLQKQPPQMDLCINLLKCLSQGDFSKNIQKYCATLSELSKLETDDMIRISRIISALASNKKDDTVNLPTLSEITTHLISHLPRLDKIEKQLFETPPFPSANAFNAVLSEPGHQKLESYCQAFDFNPLGKSREHDFAMDRVEQAILGLENLMQGTKIPHDLQLHLARQLTYIETLGYTDPLNPNDNKGLKNLTGMSRPDLKKHASTLLDQFRNKQVPKEQFEHDQLKLFAYLREIYFRTTGLFPTTTQMLTLLLSEHPDFKTNDQYTNLLMRIKTGEGKSLITPMLAVLQWSKGGTVDVCTANRTLLVRDYKRSCKPFFDFFSLPGQQKLIPSASIQADSDPSKYQLNGINCSTLEDMSLFLLAAKEAKHNPLKKRDAHIKAGHPIHLVLDECDDALLDQSTLYKLVAQTKEMTTQPDSIAWIYQLAYEFIRLPAFQNTDMNKGGVWDEEEDIDQFRVYLNTQINEKYQGDADKQKFINSRSNTHLSEWILASCKAAKLVENKHFVIQSSTKKDESGQAETNQDAKENFVCVPLFRSSPKTGCIFTDNVQQALQARMAAVYPKLADKFLIEAAPPVLASQSARHLVQSYQDTHGRLVGISGTPGDSDELKNLATLLGTQALGIPPHAGDNRKVCPPAFTLSFEASMQAIKNAIDKIKVPITTPTRTLDPKQKRQTHEDKTKHNLESDLEIERWNNTQTQPMLIIAEDFDEALKIEQSLQAYAAAGFTLQRVTGKESPEDLEIIIKNAGRANTITIGTAMLARGIDIDPGGHEKGLFVIQTYTDSERITTQIAGRAARNGKQGTWLPIYRATPPTHWFKRFLYFVIGFFVPAYRRHVDQQAIEALQRKIKEQATVERHYTQAVDHIQQTLMQQVEAWEGLLNELYPNDPKLQTELYEWREELLREMNKFQTTNLSKETLEANIRQFKTAICSLWVTLKAEKWEKIASEATQTAKQQQIKLVYLRSLDLSQELLIQSALQKQTQLFKTGSYDLSVQSLEATVLDKAGATLHYTKPDVANEKALKLAQSKQLLPQLISQLAFAYTPAIEKLRIESIEKKENATLLTALIEKIVNQTNKLFIKAEDTGAVAKAYFKLYQEELGQAKPEEVHALLKKIKPLILAYHQSLNEASLIERFKAQSIFLTFMKLYEQSGLKNIEKQILIDSVNQDANDTPITSEELKALNNLHSRNEKEIMKQLAVYLIGEFGWAKTTPAPLHARFEREVAIIAAKELHEQALLLMDKPDDQACIQDLYKLLQQHQVQLQNKTLCSVGHTSPRHVIETAIAAIDVLTFIPNKACEPAFRESCHDLALIEYHQAKFRASLKANAPGFKTNVDKKHWEKLVKRLTDICDQGKSVHVFSELQETIQRFLTYPALNGFKKSLLGLSKQLNKSIDSLNQAAGIINKDQAPLFEQKANQFASLFRIDKEKVHIRASHDGFKSFLEMQIETAPTQTDLEGYQSPALKQLQAEKLKIEHTLATLQGPLDEHKIQAIASPEITEAFHRLMAYKQLMQPNEPHDLSWLPEAIQRRFHHLEVLRSWNWETQEVKLNVLKQILDSNDPDFVKINDVVKQKDDIQRKLPSIRADEEKSHVAHTDAISNQDKRQVEIDAVAAIVQNNDTNQVIRLTQMGRLGLLKRSKQTLDDKCIETIKEFEAHQKARLKCEATLMASNKALEKMRLDCIQKIELMCISQSQAHVEQTLTTRIQKAKAHLEAGLQTIADLEKVEAKKSTYQTRRFFTTAEMFKYEADLRQEEMGLMKEEVDVPGMVLAHVS